MLKIVTPALKSLAGGAINSNAVSSTVSTSITCASGTIVGQKEGSGHEDIVDNSNSSSVNSNATTNATPLIISMDDDPTRQDHQGNISHGNDLSNINVISIDTTTTTINTTTTTANTSTNTTSTSSNKEKNNKGGAHKKDKNNHVSSSGVTSSGSTSSGSGVGDSTSEDNKKAVQPSIRRAVVGPSFRPTKRDDAAVVGSGRTLEGGDIIWVPPTTQSGDGKTSLNSKYGY